MELILALFGIACVGLGYCLGRWHANKVLLSVFNEVFRKVGK